jgi:hypothetical protein
LTLYSQLACFIYYFSDFASLYDDEIELQELREKRDSGNSTNVIENKNRYLRKQA